MLGIVFFPTTCCLVPLMLLTLLWLLALLINSLNNEKNFFGGSSCWYMPLNLFLSIDAIELRLLSLTLFMSWSDDLSLSNVEFLGLWLYSLFKFPTDLLINLVLL